MAKAVLSGALLTLLPAVAFEQTARAQAPSGSAAPSPGMNKIHTSKTIFHLPIKIDDQARGSLREVYLYVKDGSGPWLRKDAVPPTQTHFTFRVPHDGEYWFSVVTMDKQGRMTPADVSKEPPQLMVVVDTRPPEPSVPAPTPTSAVPPPPPLPGAAVVQTSAPATPAASAPAPPALVPSVPPPPMVSSPPSLPNVPLPPVPEIKYQPSVAGEAPSSRAAVSSSHPGRQLLNTTRASIDYRIDQVGPSGVGKVDIWLTTDEGHTWQRYGEDADHRSPAEINLPGEGLFGIRLVVTNGNGFGGKAPVPGDTPASQIEVDLTKPFAQLREVEPVGANGTIDIRWTASDKNLGPEPISLFYAPSREGPWLPVATGLKNDGVYHWAFPRSGVSQFLLRLECVDLAGNMTRCETSTPVTLDTTEPTVQVIGVNPVHGPGMHPSGN
jgi:hypothetical protein